MGRISGKWQMTYLGVLAGGHVGPKQLALAQDQLKPAHDQLKPYVSLQNIPNQHVLVISTELASYREKLEARQQTSDQF